MSLSAPGLASDHEVLRFALRTLEVDQLVALATVVGVDGPFSRPIGAQLAIASDGTFVGSISGGCLETALCTEAQTALADSENKLLRYGEGSPFHDVRLPCGGGIDLFLDTHVAPTVLSEVLNAVERREERSIAIDTTSASGPAMSIVRTGQTEVASELFVRSFRPRPRIVLAGRGWEIVALSELVSAAGYELAVLSQEPATLEYCKQFTDDLVRLTTPGRSPELKFDKQTAFVCLFHEHEWEVGLLEQAVRSDAFYVGALGSKQTSETRRELLGQRGLVSAEVDKIHGPLGLFHAQSPRALAISALAQIMSVMTDLKIAP